MKTVGDLLDEAKKRTILVLFWVVGLAYLMSLTSHSVWVNIPVALLIITLLRCLSGEIVIRWRSSRPFTTAIPLSSASRKRGRGRQAPAKYPSINRAMLDSWRRGVESPEVEAALNDLTKSVVNEWVTGLWFSSISSDQEFPDELTSLINGVLGEVAQRAKRVNLITLLTQDIVDLVASHLELFRRTQARVGADILGILSTEERDENLKQALAATGELHPALVSAESEVKVLQKLMGGVIALVLKPSDGNSRVLRSLARELLACAVMRPVMNIASPAFINMQIENAALNAPAPKAEVSGSKPAAKQRAPDPPVFKEPSEPGLEMVEVTPSKGQQGHGESLTRGASTDLGGKIESKSPGSSPIDKKDGYASSQKEKWAAVLEVVNQRKTQALAPEHLDNLWTKGRNYKKRELNKAAVKPKETNVTKEQPISHPLAVEPPVPQVKPKRPDGKTTELVELRPVSQQLSEVSLAGLVQEDLPASKIPGSEQVVPMRKSRSSGGLLDGWQDLEHQHYQDGIPSMLKAGEGPGYDPSYGGKCAARRVGGKRTYMESAQADNVALTSQSSWTNHLQVDVVGAHFEKSGSKTFAVYSIFVTDGPDGSNRTWEVQRRFRNFEQLHRSLKDKPYYCLSLPAKRFLSSNLDNSFIRQRCALLDKYLKDLLSIPSVAELHEVWDFLSANSQTYGFGESPSMFKTLTSNVDDAVDDMFRQFRSMSDTNQEKPKTATSDIRQRSVLQNSASANNNPNTNHLQILTLPSSNSVNNRSIVTAAETKVAAQQMVWEEDHFDPSHYGLPHNIGHFAWRSEYDLQPSGQSAGSPFGSDPGLLEAQRDSRNNFEGNKLYDGKERSLSEGHSPVGSLAGSDMAEDDNLAIPPDWGPPKVSVPLLNLVDGIFELQGRGWIRRQVFWMAKQILTLGMGDAIDDFLLGKIQWLRKEEVVAGGIRWLHRILWPDGVFLTRHPSRQKATNSNAPNGQAESFEQRLEAARRAGVVREIILDRAPAGLVSLIGSKQYKRCATDLYFFLQSGVCIKQLAFSLLEMLLVSAFPELHELVLEVHAM